MFICKSKALPAFSDTIHPVYCFLSVVSYWLQVVAGLRSPAVWSEADEFRSYCLPWEHNAERYLTCKSLHCGKYSCPDCRLGMVEWIRPTYEISCDFSGWIDFDLIISMGSHKRFSKHQNLSHICFLFIYIFSPFYSFPIRQREKRWNPALQVSHLQRLLCEKLQPLGPKENTPG